MEALNCSEGVSSFAGENDKLPRTAQLVRIRVTCVVPNTQVESHVLPVGTHTIEVLRKQLPAIVKGLVRDEEEAAAVERAMASYATSMDRATPGNVSELYDAGMEKVPEFGPAEVTRVRRLVETSGEEALNKVERTIWRLRCNMEQLTGESWQSHYEVGDHYQPVRPLTKLEVLEDNLPLQEEIDHRDYVARSGAAIAAAAGAGGGAGGEVVAELREQLAAMKRELEQLKQGKHGRR